MPKKLCDNRTEGHVCTAECFAPWIPKTSGPEPAAQPHISFKAFLRSMFAKPASRRTPDEISRLVRAIVTPKNMEHLVRGTLVAWDLKPYQRLDIVRDTLTALVLNRFGKFDPEKKDLLEYVRGAVRIQTVVFLKAAHELHSSEAYVERMPDSYPSPEKVAIDKSNLRRLTWCLQRLPIRARVVLAAEQNETAEQTGARLGATAGNIRVQRHRARTLLNECVECGDDRWDVPPDDND
jgi:RNA polymerase sigma factor (sigma-70 family)